MRWRNSSLKARHQGIFLMQFDPHQPEPIAAILARVVDKARFLDHRADKELSEGRHTVAERLATLAAELRMEAAR
jgi:hypothetical protein